ncbi:MAG: DUF1572 family protein [Bryobacterales bacterium]
MTLDELQEIISRFRKLKSQADRALAQVRGDELFVQLDDESNSLAVIMKHIAGNMRSRWTDFLTTDGEKPDRQRDGEFELLKAEDRDEIFRQWEAGWQVLFREIEALKAEDLGKTVTIRSEPHSVPQALFRQLAHYAEHVGQIVFLAKHLRSREWQTLSIPRGKSDEVLARMKRRFEK